MKNFLILLLPLILTLSLGFLYPNYSLAQTPTQSLILQLQEQVKALQEQLKTLQSEIKTTKTELEAVKTELKFSRSLSRGAIGDEVRQLQEFLKQQFPEIYTGPITGFFGPLTESAIKKFQEKQGIESIGVVGPKTLSKLNELITEGAGASGVIPPGLLIAPGIEKKLEIPSTTTPVIATTPALVVTTPTTITPVQPLTSASTGVCLIKDRYTDIPRFDIANFGNGFAKYAVSGVNTVSGLQTSCTKTIYDYLLQQYCKSNSNPVQRLIETYDYRGIAEPQNLVCSSLGCSFVDCSSVAGLAPIAMPTTATTTTATATSVTPTATATSTTTTSTTTSSSPTTTTTTTSSSSQTTTTATATTPTTASTTPISTTTTTGTPVISGVGVEQISKSSVTIFWSTNQEAESVVDYGLTSSYGSYSVGIWTAAHKVNITNLQPSTVYHYRVKSKYINGNDAVSADYTFTTSADTTTTVAPLAITFVSVTNITDTGATITWTTNQPAFSFVRYGIFNDYRYLDKTDNISQTNHSVTLTGLNSGTTYFYWASANTSNEDVRTATWTFTTSTSNALAADTTPADTIPPVISNVRAENITTSGAYIKWITNEPADQGVDWGVSSSAFRGTGVTCAQNTSRYITDHCVDLNVLNLSPNTTYYYKVRSDDQTGNFSYSGVQQFTTLAAISTSSINSHPKNLAVISQMLNSLSGILEKLSQLLK